MVEPQSRFAPLARLLLALVALLVLLAGCNGGGSGGSPTDPGGGPVAFQGQVASVDGRTLVLVGGLRVTVTDRTTFDPQGDLFAIDTIRAALLRGETVVARGTGERVTTGVLEALEIRVDTSAAGQPVQFAGVVATLDRTQGVLTLRSGTVLALDGSTVFDATGDATSFNQIVSAFDRGDLITVDGQGTLRGDASILVAEIRVEVDTGQGADTQFAGVVAAVDRAGQRMTLTNGLAVAVGSATRFDPLGDLRTFAALASAVEQGQTVTVEGDGVFRADGSVLARQIRAEIDTSGGPAVSFAGVVATVDRNAGRLTLRSGTMLALDGATRFDPAGDATSFNQIVAAFDRGDLITVDGQGNAQPGGVLRVTEVLVTLTGGAGGATQFSGVVASVDTPSQRLTLANGVMVAVDANTRFDVQGDLRSFSALATAVSLGTVVTVEGDGAFRADGSILATRLRADT